MTTPSYCWTMEIICWVCCWLLNHNYIMAFKTAFKFTLANAHSEVFCRDGNGNNQKFKHHFHKRQENDGDRCWNTSYYKKLTGKLAALYPNYWRIPHIPSNTIFIIWVSLVEMDGLILTMQVREVIPQIFYHFSYKPWELYTQNMGMPLLRKHW